MFRVPRDHDGKGLVCQSCRRLLRIPAAGELTPPLLKESSPLHEAATRTSEPAGTPMTEALHTVAAPATTAGDPVLRRSKHRSRKRRSASSASGESDRPSWEHATHGSSRSSRHDRRMMRWMLGGGVVLFALIVWVVVLTLRRGGEALSKAPPQVPPVMKLPVAVATPGEAELPTLMQRGGASLLAAAEPLARRFLEAKTLDELLPLVREPQRAKPRMQREYPQALIEAPGLVEFNVSGNVVFDRSTAVVEVRTRKFEVRQLALVDTAEGLKIDWESWVGWSDMTWPALLAATPTAAQVFRVIVKRVDYYNFGFADDKKWKSYRLESMDGEHMIFGFVERGSAVDRKIQLSSDLEQAPMILKIRFPAAAGASNNQVFIDDKLADGWVEMAE